VERLPTCRPHRPRPLGQPVSNAYNFTVTLEPRFKRHFRLDKEKGAQRALFFFSGSVIGKRFGSWLLHRLSPAPCLPPHYKPKEKGPLGPLSLQPSDAFFDHWKYRQWEQLPRRSNATVANLADFAQLSNAPTLAVQKQRRLSPRAELLKKHSTQPALQRNGSS
jgi:hypothetical protein